MSNKKVASKVPAKADTSDVPKAAKRAASSVQAIPPIAGESALTLRNVAFQSAGSDRVEMTVQSVIANQRDTEYATVEVPRSNAIQELLSSLADRLSANDVMITDLADNLTDILSTYSPIHDQPTQPIPDNASPLYVSITNVLEQAQRQADMLAAIISSIEV